MDAVCYPLVDFSPYAGLLTQQQAVLVLLELPDPPPQSFDLSQVTSMRPGFAHEFVQRLTQTAQERSLAGPAFYYARSPVASVLRGALERYGYQSQQDLQGSYRLARCPECDASGYRSVMRAGRLDQLPCECCYCEGWYDAQKVWSFTPASTPVAV